MDFGKKLSKLRELRNLTKQELAREFNISRQLVSSLESGNSRPNSDMLVAIANRFNVSIDWLLGRSEDATYSICTEDKNEITIMTFPEKLTDDERAFTSDFVSLLLKQRRAKSKTK